MRVQKQLRNQQKVFKFIKFFSPSDLDNNLFVVRESEAKLAEETAALKEKEEKLLDIKLKVKTVSERHKISCIKMLCCEHFRDMIVARINGIPTIHAHLFAVKNGERAKQFLTQNMNEEDRKC